MPVDLVLTRAGGDSHKRKNFFFAGCDTGGERAAIAYTLLGSCKLADVDPVRCLSEVLPRLSRRVRILDTPALEPARWKATCAAAGPAQD